MKIGIRHIIFDLDGTLVDSSRDITNALNHALTPHGLRELSVEDTIKLVGEGIGRLIEKVLPEELLPRRAEIMDEFLRYYEEHISDYSRLYPGVREALDMLKDNPLSVVTNKREHLSVKLLKNLGVLQYFRSIVGPDTTGERKPSPKPVLYACERAGVPPSNSILVGDSNIDIETGKAAGIITVAVPYGYRTKEDLKDADFHLKHDLTELIDLIKNITT